MEFNKPTLVFICGWPASGKSALAARLNTNLKLHLVDIDAVRLVSTGLPYPHPNESEELMERDRAEMAAAYALLFSICDWHLQHRRSLIATCTLSRQSGQDALLSIFGHNPFAQLKLFWCQPEDDSPQKVEQIFNARRFGDGEYVGGVNSPARYFEVKERYVPITLPHCVIKTWGGSISLEEEIDEAMTYLGS